MMTSLERAEALADNWKHFNCFSWDGPPDEDEAADSHWCIVYTHHRDSDPLDRANAEVIEEALKPFFGEDVREEHHSHWAVGWVEGFAIRVYDAEGKVTPAFTTWHEIQEQLEDYPILDEDRYSELDAEEAEEFEDWIHEEA